MNYVSVDFDIFHFFNPVIREIRPLYKYYVSKLICNIAEQMAKGSNIWRLAKPGYIKLMRTTPAMEVIQMVPLLMKLKKQLD